LIPKAPTNWGKVSQARFKKQPHKLQVFIYLKYNQKYCKRFIMRNMYISAENTFYKYDKIIQKHLKNNIV